MAYEFDRKAWLEQMAANTAPGGKIDQGPMETLGSKPGRAKPSGKRAAGPRVPPVSAAGSRKL